MFNQLLLVGCEELRVLYVFHQEVTLMRPPFLFVFLVIVRGGRTVPRVEDSVQEKLHRGLLGLAGGWGRTGDHGGGEDQAALRTRGDNTPPTVKIICLRLTL